MDTKRRSVLKALSWRFLATLITTGVAYGITGEVHFALEIGLLDTTVKFVVYFMHERAWNRIAYGRMVAGEGTDYQI